MSPVFSSCNYLNRTHKENVFKSSCEDYYKKFIHKDGHNHIRHGRKLHR